MSEITISSQDVNRYMRIHKVILSFTVMVIALYGGVYSLAVAREKSLVRQGNEIVQLVELFKAKNGRLPISMAEIGLPYDESGPLYYNTLDNGKEYVVSFGLSLGESYGYYSDLKEWQ